MKILVEDGGKCLTDLVGFRGCGKQTVAQFVDGVPGISEMYASNIYDTSTFPDFVDFEKSIKREAYLFFRMSLISSINKYKTVQTVIIDTDNPHPRRNAVSRERIPPQQRWVGVVVDVPYNKDIVLEAESLFIHSANDANSTLGIFDLVLGEQVHTKAIEIKKGLNEIEIKKSYLVSAQGERVFVGIRQDTVTLLELWCGEFASLCNCSCAGIVDEFSSVAFDVCENFEDSYMNRLAISGVCLKAKIRCSIDNLICRYKEQFAEVYKYAEALQLMKEGLVTARRNWLIDNMDVYRLQEIAIPATEKMFYMTLNSTVKSLKQLWNSSICFVCDPNETGEIIESSVV